VLNINNRECVGEAVFEPSSAVVCSYVFVRERLANMESANSMAKFLSRESIVRDLSVDDYGSPVQSLNLCSIPEPF